MAYERATAQRESASRAHRPSPPRGVRAPPSASVLTLQRRVGNRATGRAVLQRTATAQAEQAQRTGPDAGPGVSWDFASIPVFANDQANRIQRRTSIATFDDPLEAAAEAMAETVMRAPVAGRVEQRPSSHQARVWEPRRPALAQRFAPSLPEPVRPGSAPRDTVAEELRATTGRGSPIPDATRRFMERRIGSDFSQVRIHATGYSDRLSEALTAQAFTVGRDIYFRSGQYQPDSVSGKRLLAHELTHVVQQAARPGLIQRLIRTPYPWRGIILPAIGANIRSSPDSSDPANILDAIPRGQPVTVIAATGNWLRVQSLYQGPMLEGYIHHTLVDDATSQSMAGTVGTTMVWKPSGPGSGTDFESWASAPTETPFPAVASSTVMNCWEAVLLSAYRAGSISWTWINNLYTSVPVADWVTAMSRGARQGYAVPGPNLHMPQRGDLVFFDGIAHVALATGTGSEVYTFWPPPNTPFTPGGTTDKVKIFTIESLVAWWTANMPPEPVVEFAAPRW